MDCLTKKSVCDYMQASRMKNCTLVSSRTIRSMKGGTSQGDQEAMAKDALFKRDWYSGRKEEKAYQRAGSLSQSVPVD